MLPLLGQSMVAHDGANPSASTAATIGDRAADDGADGSALPHNSPRTRGYWIVFLLALVALPIRGITASLVTGHPGGLAPVQDSRWCWRRTLNVYVPGLVARILAGTGHVNAGLGAVMTLQGIGAALSTTVGGIVAERFGYPAAFVALAAIAAVGVWRSGCWRAHC